MAVGSHTVRIWTLQPRLFHLGEDAVTHGYSLEMDTGHMGIVGLEFLDDHTLLCAHADGVLQVWTLSTPDQPSETFDASQSFLEQNVPTMGRLEVYGRDRRIERASTTMRARLTWELHLDIRLDACDIIFVKDRLRVLLGGTRGEIYWVEILQNMPPIAVHIGQLSTGITLAKLSPTGDRGATASRDRKIAIWRPLEELPIDDSTGAWRVFNETGGEVWALAFSNSGRYLAGGGIDNGVYLWDLLAKNSLRAVSYDHEGWISDLAWSQEDRVLACASWDNTVGIFRGADLAPLYCFEYHQDYVSQVEFVPNSNFLISSSYDRSLAIWDWRNAGLVKELREHTDWVQALEWLGHGTFMSAASDKSIRVWSSATLACEVVLGEGKEDDWLSASLGSMEGLERRSAATSGGFKTIRPTEHAASLDAKLRRALAATDSGLGGEVSMFFEALPDEERDRVAKLSEEARSRRLEEERAATDEFRAIERHAASDADEDGKKTVPDRPSMPPRETVAGLPATVVPEADDAPSYSVSEVGIGDRISSEISDLSEIVESSIADDEESTPKPPETLLRGAPATSTTEHSGLFALEYSEGTMERLRSPFHVSNSGLLDLQEASLAVDISGIRFNASSNVQFDSHADDVPFAPTARRPQDDPLEDDEVARTVREESDSEDADHSSNRNVSRSQLRELFKKHLAKGASEASEAEPSPPVPEATDAPAVETEASLPEEFEVGESSSSSSEEPPDVASGLERKSTPLFQRSEAILEAVEASQASEQALDEEEQEKEEEQEIVLVDEAPAEDVAAEDDAAEADEAPAESVDASGSSTLEPEVGFDASLLDAVAESDDAGAESDDAGDIAGVDEIKPPESEVSFASTSFAPVEQAPEESESLANETEIDISVLGKERVAFDASDDEDEDKRPAEQVSEVAVAEDDVSDARSVASEPRDEPEPAPEPEGEQEGEQERDEDRSKPSLNSNLLARLKAARASGAFAAAPTPESSSRPEKTSPPAELAPVPQQDAAEPEEAPREDGLFEIDFESLDFQFSEAAGDEEDAREPVAREPAAEAHAEDGEGDEGASEEPGESAAPMMGGLAMDGDVTMPPKADGDVTLQPRWERISIDRPADASVREDSAGDESSSEVEEVPVLTGSLHDANTRPEEEEDSAIDVPEVPSSPPTYDPSTSVEDIHPGNLATIQESFAPVLPAGALSLISSQSEESEGANFLEPADEAPTGSSPMQASEVAALDSQSGDAISDAGAEREEEDSSSASPPVFMRPEEVEQEHERAAALEEDAGDEEEPEDVRSLFSRTPGKEPTKRTEPLGSLLAEVTRRHRENLAVAAAASSISPESTPRQEEDEADVGAEISADEEETHEYEPSMFNKLQGSIVAGPGVMLGDTPSAAAEQGESFSSSFAESDAESDSVAESEHSPPGAIASSEPSDVEFAPDDGLDTPSAPSLETHSGILRPAKLQRRSLVIDDDDDASEEPTEQAPGAPVSPEMEPAKPVPSSVPMTPLSTLGASEQTSPRDTAGFPMLPEAPPVAAGAGLAESTPAYSAPGQEDPSMPPSMSVANATSFAEDTRAPKEGTRPGLNPLGQEGEGPGLPPEYLSMDATQNANSTMLGMSNFVYRPRNQAEDTSMAEELGAFPEVSEVLSQPEYTDFTPKLIDVGMSEIWQMRMAEGKASMKIFKRASAQTQRWRNFDRVDLDLGQIFSVVYNGENSLFAASGARRHVEVWSMRVGRLFQLPGRGRVIYSLTSTPNGRLLIGGDDRAYIHAWLLPGKLGAAPEPSIPRAMLTGHVSPISCLAVNSTGKLLLSGSLDGTARLWSLEDGECLAVLDHAAEPISGVVFWSKGLATVSHEGKLRLWDRRGIQIDLIEGYGKFNSVASHRSSVYAAAEDGRLIKYQRGKAAILDQQSCPIKDIRVNPDGLLASVNAKGKVKFFFNEHDAPLVLDTGVGLTCLDFGTDVLFAGTSMGKAEVFKKL